MLNLIRRLWYLVRRNQNEADLREEMETHRALVRDQLERDGVAPLVATYSALLTSMAIAATRLDSAQAMTGRRLVAAGALTFVASDATLGLRKFVLDDPRPLPDLASGGRGGRRLSLSTSSPRRSETDQRQWMEGAVMATYTAAQFLISEGAGRL